MRMCSRTAPGAVPNAAVYTDSSTPGRAKASRSSAAACPGVVDEFTRAPESDFT